MWRSHVHARVCMCVWVNPSHTSRWRPRHSFIVTSTTPLCLVVFCCWLRNETCFELKWLDYKLDLFACIMGCNGYYVHITCISITVHTGFCFFFCYLFRIYFVSHEWSLLWSLPYLDIYSKMISDQIWQIYCFEFRIVYDLL